MENNESSNVDQLKNLGKRNLDVATEASIDLVSLNNKIVKMRPVVRRVKVHLIHKMTRRINVLKKKKGSDEQRQKNLSKGQRMLDEIQAMKHLSADKISKFALSSTLTFADVCKRATASDELRALSRMSEHKLLSDIVKQFRKEHEDWQSLTAFVLMNPGRRFKKKRRRKPKDKTATNIKAGKDLVKVYLGGKFEGNEEQVLQSKSNLKPGLTNVDELEEKIEQSGDDGEMNSEEEDEEKLEEIAESDEESEEERENDIGDKSVIASKKVKQRVTYINHGEQEDIGDDDDDDGDDDDDDDDDDGEEENLVQEIKSNKKQQTLSSRIKEAVDHNRGKKKEEDRKIKKLSFVEKLSPRKNSDSKQSTTKVSESERKEMVVKKLNLDEIPDEINVSVTLDEVPSNVNKTKQRHKDSFFASSDVDENSDEEKSSDERLSDADENSDFDEDNEQLYRGGKVMHSTFLGSLADKSDSFYKNKMRGGYNRNSYTRDFGRGRSHDFDSKNRQGHSIRHGNTGGRFDGQKGGDRRFSQNDRKSYSKQKNFNHNTWDNRKQNTDSGKKFGKSDNSNKTFSKQSWNGKNKPDSNISRNKKSDSFRNENLKQSSKLGESAEKLHPSWQASKKRKEQSQIQVFAGKKIKFDDD